MKNIHIYTETPNQPYAELLVLIAANNLLKKRKGTGLLCRSNPNYVARGTIKIEKFVAISLNEQDVDFTHSAEQTWFSNGNYKYVTLEQFRAFVSSDPDEIKIGDYTVEFKEDGVQVGCTFVNKERILQIAKHFQT